MKACCPWRWVASGKHPSVIDYINIGQGFSLASSFSEWLSKGYQAEMPQKNSGHSGCSWRFWVKGKSKNEISCGLLKDSSDSIGRPYPLLIMGNGSLEGWEGNWNLVPEVCEAVWNRMEKLSCENFGNLKVLEQELVSLPQPLPVWSDSLKAVDSALQENSGMSSADFAFFFEQIQGLSGKNAGFIVLDQFNDYDRIIKVTLAGTVLKRCRAGVPSTVFIGGTAELTCYAFFHRPLTISDFSTLWTRLSQRLKVGEQ